MFAPPPSPPSSTTYHPPHPPTVQPLPIVVTFINVFDDWRVLLTPPLTITLWLSSTLSSLPAVTSIDIVASSSSPNKVTSPHRHHLHWRPQQNTFYLFSSGGQWWLLAWCRSCGEVSRSIILLLFLVSKNKWHWGRFLIFKNYKIFSLKNKALLAVTRGGQDPPHGTTIFNFILTSIRSIF